MRFNFGSALLAGLIATIVMTIVMFFFGIDIMRILGHVAGMKDPVAVYIIGGIIHLVVGLIWGIIYALIFEPWLAKKLPGFVAGGLFSIIPFILAMTLMGVFIHTIQSIFGVEKSSMNMQEMCNPCRPYSNDHMMDDEYNCSPNMSKRQYSRDYDDANSPAMRSPSYKNQPCSPASYSQERYGSDPYDKNGYCRPCKPMMNPCAPEGTGLPPWLVSLINHVVFGVVLGLVYRPHRKEPEQS